jgi:hypothetical protein
MPDKSTVIRWLADIPEFRDQYARARELQADVYADEIVAISDEVTAEAAAVAKARLQTDSRKWVAGKLRPKVYGDASTIKHADADGNKIEFSERLKQEIATKANGGLPSPMPDGSKLETE